MKIASKILKPVMLVLGFALIAACSKVTSRNFEKITTGMTKDEVRKILGEPDRVETGAVMGLSGTTFYYKSGKSEASVTFVNDAMMSKGGSLK